MIGRKGNPFISCGSTSLAGIRNGAGRNVFFCQSLPCIALRGRVAKNVISAKVIPEPESPRTIAGGMGAPLLLWK